MELRIRMSYTSTFYAVMSNVIKKVMRIQSFCCSHEMQLLDVTFMGAIEWREWCCWLQVKES